MFWGPFGSERESEFAGRHSLSRSGALLVEKVGVRKLAAMWRHSGPTGGWQGLSGAAKTTGKLKENHRTAKETSYDEYMSDDIR